MPIYDITTVGKTFRVVCTVTEERFVGWFDVKGNEVTARPVPDELTLDKFYVEENGNSYTLVIQNVVVGDGGDYTCKGDVTEKTFALYVECKCCLFPLEGYTPNAYHITRRCMGTAVLIWYTVLR